MKSILLISSLTLSLSFKGIDVSTFQGDINWSAVKNSGIKFAIIRAGYGKEISQKDNKFDRNYENAKAVGMPIGVYWYSYAKSVEAAEQEAKTCLEIIKGKQFEWPIYYDIEESSILGKGKNFVSSIAKKFCRYLESKKYFCGIYASANPLNNLFDDECKTQFVIWVAHYNVDHPGYHGNWGVWQYSSKGSVSGIEGNVDMDEAVIDYEPIIKNAHLNGW